MGNNGLAKVVDIDDIYLEINNGMKLVLNNVKYIPDIHLNLISTSKLDDKGYYSTFSDGQWKLTKSFLVMAEGEKYSSLYIIHAKLSKEKN